MIVKRVFAQTSELSYRFKGFGPLGLEGNEKPVEMLTRILSGVVGVMTFAAGIWFIIKIIIAGYSFISSGGDANKIKASQQTIINSILGLAVVVVAIFLLSLIGHLLHIEFLNIGGFVDQVSPK